MNPNDIPCWRGSLKKKNNNNKTNIIGIIVEIIHYYKQYDQHLKKNNIPNKYYIVKADTH